VTFLEIAHRLLARSLPLTPLRPKSKVAFIPNWNEHPITNMSEALAVANEYGNDLNCAVVAKAAPGGFCIFEVDDPTIPEKIKTDTGNSIYASYCVRSSPGRGHIYFKHTAASIALGNASQDTSDNKELWSFRANSQYVVSEHSIHPRTGLPYEAVTTKDIIEVPEWLIDWMKKNQTSRKDRPPLGIDGDRIARGGHDNYLNRLAGKLRYVGMEEESIYNTLVEVVEKRFDDYGSDYKEMCRKHAHYITQKPVGKNTSLLVNGVPVGTAAASSDGTMEVEERPTIPLIPYPKFPSWIMAGTSIYEGLVKPFCEINSRYPEFMFVPALALMLNYLGTRVRIVGSGVPLSIFMVVIGRAGKTIKSSSVQDGVKYFEYAGLMSYSNSQMNNADGRVLVFTIGSPEGFGKEMNRLNCKNGVLFYDELATLTNKAGIEGSSLGDRLCTLYEAGLFQNIVKSRKDSFSLEPGTYVATVIACDTDKNFLKHWAPLSGSTTGLDDRFFFLLQPEKLKVIEPFVHVNTMEAALVTRRLIDKAVKQAEYSIVDKSPLQATIEKIGNRAELRVEKFALAFAVDLGRDEIDEDCIERALALIKYEQSVKNWFKTFESTNKESGIQMELIHILQKNNGQMALRELERQIHAIRYGTTLWNISYRGLLQLGWIRETGKGVRSDPKIVTLLRTEEDDD
jgi:Bifunctional DNA primase/polymerase, N-terminal